jgi:hypothetical protein
MENISPTIKINISIKPNIVKKITLSDACPAKEIVAYKSLFQEFPDIFAWSYIEIPRLDPAIVEHCIDSWLDVSTIRQN